MNGIMVIGIAQIAAGFLLLCFGGHIVDTRAAMREQERKRVADEVRKAVRFDAARQVFNSVGHIMTDDRGNTQFYAAQDVQELIDGINKVLK